jgi:hypothetical protein
VNVPAIIIFLPYFVSILLKLAKLTLDRRLMINALEDLSVLPRPSGRAFELSSDIREILLKHLSVATLKSTAILTAITSLFSAFIIASQQKPSKISMGILLAFLVLGVLLIAWLLPKKVHYFSRKGISFGTRVVLIFCLYDLLLAALSYWRLMFPLSGS